MSDILVLMRHGKAEKRGESPDFERVLTEAGKRSLRATLPPALGLFPNDKQTVQVWSSPAARAEQTARLMQRACKRHGANVSPELTLVDSLWSQDEEEFLAQVRACEADVVVAVGHNPFIEDLTYELTGSRIDFATGGFAAVQLPPKPVSPCAQEEGDKPRAEAEEDAAPGHADGESAEEQPEDDSIEPESLDGPLPDSELPLMRPSTETGRLLWFAQGPVSQKWKTLVQMEAVLSKGAETVEERRTSFLANPDDIETMHKFRVSIRTLRSLLAFVSPWQSAQQNKESQALLKSVVQTTSRLRELDVLSEQAREIEGASPEFVEYCASAAAAERKKVYDVISSKRTAKKIARVSEMLHEIEWRKRIDSSGLEATEIRARFDSLAEKLQGDLEALDLADVEKTHDVRKSAKRVRYDAEKFKALLGDDAVGIAKNMTAHQDNLGAICDARVNIDIINGFPVSELPEPVAWDLALLRAQNETFLYTTLRKS